ncbi:MAG TPA: SHOCT domain-containing protein [Thermohalobaculum sp.]|nr:SHOCT domain-containing protein [Thermohalobaculum sp.]
MRATIAAVTAALAATAPGMALAQYNQGYYGSHMWGDGWHGWFLGPVMMLLWLGLIVGVVVLVVRWMGAGGPGAARPGGSEATDILRARFARGEIDKAEFEERLALLKH